MTFHKDKSRKLVNTRLNVQYIPKEGDTWVYFDAEREGPVEWYLEKVEDGQATIVKRTGRSPGFRASFPVTGFAGRRWKPKDAQGEEAVCFPCPSCGGPNPIRRSDYVCDSCRAELDIPD